MAEPVDSAAQLAARALSQKAYKKGKKKRAKENKNKRERVLGLENENKQAEQLQPAPTKWCRVFDFPKSTNRPVDDDKINELLEKRSKSKAEKNYSVSDEITLTLIDMEIVYNDEKRQWHTRLLLTVAQKQAKKEQAKKRSSENKNATEEPATKKPKKNTKKKQ
jgi:cysteinyl-tRNA synthetase